MKQQLFKASQKLLEQYRLTINTIPHAVFISDPKNQILFWNKAFEKLTAKNPKEFPSLRCWQIIHDLKSRPQNCLELVAKKTKLPKSAEIEINRRCFQAMATPIFDENNKYTGSVHILFDITQQKQQSDALIRREKILEAVAIAGELFIKTKNWQSVVPKVLALIGKASKVSRVYIFEKHLSSKGRLLASQRFEWVSKGITPQINNPLMQNLDVIKAGFGRWVKILTKGAPVYGLVKDFPVKEQKILSAQSILSIAVVPIFVAKDLWGFIGFDECINERTWTQIEIDTLKALASLIGSVIENAQKDKILRESEEKFRSLVNNLNIGVYRNTPDPKGKFIEANPSLCRMLGYNSQEINKLSVTDFYQNPQERENLLTKIKKYGFLKDEEIHLKKKDGTPIVAQITARAHRNLKGEINWIDGVIEDITERKKIEQQIAESEEKYRTLIEMSPYAIAAHSEGKIIFVNQSAVKLLGAKSPQQLIGKPALDVVHPDYRDFVRKRIQKMLTTMKPAPTVEEKFVRLDGSVIDVEVSARPFIYQNKPAIMNIVSDITARKKAEQEQQQKIEQTIRFQETLLKLSKQKFIDFNNAVKTILKTDAQTIDVARVSFWQFSEDKKKLICQDLYWKSKDTYEKGMVLSVDKYPNYFKALRKGRVIVGNDARKDNPTREFAKDYLIPLHITSMLDAPVRLHGKVVGVVCHEHTGPMRIWTLEEQNFVASIADLISLVLESTEIKKSQEIIQVSEEKYRSLVQNLNIGIYRSTPEGRFIEVNPAMARILGYSSVNELKNTLVTATYQDPEDRKKLLDKINKYGFVKNEELYLKKKDGTSIIASVTARVHRNQKGKIDWIDGVIEDITERKKYEQALFESEEKFRTLVENIQDIIILRDAKDNVKYINPACKQVLGYTPEELMAKSPDVFHSLIHPADRKEVEEKLNRVKMGIPCSNIEYRMITKDGKIKWVSHSRTPIMENNKVIMTIGVIRDITPQKEIALQLQSAKEAAEAANRAKTAFLANMSHELRTPMHSILGFTDILLEKEENNHKERKEFLNIIRNSSDKLLHIINELLDLSRIETGKITVEHKEFDIFELANRIRFTYQPKALEKNLQFKLMLSKNLPRKLIGDSVKIEQIVTNLLDNAVKFTYQGKIEVSFRLSEVRKPNEAVLEYYVKDTGIGIEPERIPHLFEQYLQTDAYLTRATPGARLGLAIVKQLVNLMHGEIIVKSRLSKGTKFLIRHPIKLVDRTSQK
ncbi:MAG: PAS domain S-box protein [candidate division WOR-3 bacterium]|nr:PAS domain S-box protein [candidate division WOR-3 bacterium]